MQIENLMLKREHFPIKINETRGKKGRKFWILDGFEIPPYHPSMAVSGLHFELVPDLIYKAVEDAAADLEEIKDKINYAQVILNDLVKDRATGKVLFKPQIVKKDDFGIDLDSIPIIDHIYVGRREINSYGFHGDQGITIDTKLCPSSFDVPKNVKFSPELISEYGMRKGNVFLGRREIKCPYLWHRHNLDNWNAIFYKNLVIALNNKVVKRKYSQCKKKEEQGE